MYSQIYKCIWIQSKYIKIHEYVCIYSQNYNFQHCLRLALNFQLSLFKITWTTIQQTFKCKCRFLFTSKKMTFYSEFYFQSEYSCIWLNSQDTYISSQYPYNKRATIFCWLVAKRSQQIIFHFWMQHYCIFFIFLVELQQCFL